MKTRLCDGGLQQYLKLQILSMQHEDDLPFRFSSVSSRILLMASSLEIYDKIKVMLLHQ